MNRYHHVWGVNFECRQGVTSGCRLTATFATDPKVGGPKGEGKTLRAPNGVVQDSLEYFGATSPKAYWEPAKITSPAPSRIGEQRIKRLRHIGRRIAIPLCKNEER
jgi:hypothetical protein